MNRPVDYILAALWCSLAYLIFRHALGQGVTWADNIAFIVMAALIGLGRQCLTAPAWLTRRKAKDYRKFRWNDAALDAALSVYFETRKRIPDGEAAVREAIKIYMRSAA